MTASEKRNAVAAAYRRIIGRNHYSQNLRNYCYNAYKDGKYYSDCSSSVSYAYKEAGCSFGILNTAGMYYAVGTKFTDVPVQIVAGQIKNPDVLRIGDMLLYAGTDNSRPGCVGHVEMVGEISGSSVILYGHGSGYPKKTTMTAKNTSRYNSKTNTKVGNKGLIRVIRFIQDDEPVKEDSHEEKAHTGKKRTIKDGTWNIRSGPGTEYDAIGGIAGGSVVQMVDVEGWSYITIGNMSGWVSNKALVEE